MKYSINFFLFLILITSFLLPAHIKGQVLDGEVEELVVTASIIPIAIKESANAITVIDNKYINKTSASDLSNLLRNIPGLAVSRSGVMGSQTQVRIRGSEANHLLVLINGVEANNPAQSDEFNWSAIETFDIERIEVIRGPQSSIYGSDAMSGVINIITKNATEPFSARFFLESGSFDTQNGGLSAGINNGTFDLHMGISSIQTAGDNISKIGTEKDGYDNTNINLKSGLILNNQTSLDITSRQSRGMNEYDEDINFDSLIDDQDKSSNFRSGASSLKINYDPVKSGWSHQISIAHSTNSNTEFTKEIAGTATSSSKRQYRVISSILWGDLFQRLSFLAEIEKENFEQKGIINDYGIYGIYDPNQYRKRNSESLAIEYRSNISDKLIFAASTRFDNNSQFKKAHTSRLEAVYHLNKSLRFRSTLGTAIKNPTFTERFGFYNNFIGNPVLDPEDSISWELGFDKELFGGKTLLSATSFNTELENEIDGNYLDPTTFLYTSINRLGKSKRKGMELTTVTKLNNNLSLNTSYTYTDSIELNMDNIYIDEVRRPRHIASLNFSWQAMSNLHINTNIQYNGSQTDIVYPNIVALKHFTLVNLNLNYSLEDNLDIYLRLDNLLDEDYEEVFSYQTLGFGANLGMRFKF